MGQPHEDLLILEGLKQRLDEDLEQAKRLGDAGEKGSVYQAIDTLRGLVEEDIRTIREIVEPQDGQ